MIGILSYGVGNVMGIQKLLTDLDIKNKLILFPKDLDNKIDKLIIPGVGSFDFAMKLLMEKNFKNLIKDFSKNKNKYILGICVGMQILANSSEEGKLDGLGLIPGEVKKLSNAKILPHVGWNFAKKVSKNKLFDNLNDNSKFYFLHSFYFHNYQNEHKIGETNYYQKFSSIINYGNIFGVQFHPEKSYSSGEIILKNFSNLNEN